ncbi:hypothetical protein AHF37_12553 [Paragonimus kellicotti]|nr:hypothetical protein AHF37_12553 [Paragonimus kellicotti]
MTKSTITQRSDYNPLTGPPLAGTGTGGLKSFREPKGRCGPITSKNVEYCSLAGRAQQVITKMNNLRQQQTNQYKTTGESPSAQNRGYYQMISALRSGGNLNFGKKLATPQYIRNGFVNLDKDNQRSGPINLGTGEVQPKLKPRESHNGFGRSGPLIKHLSTYSLVFPTSISTSTQQASTVIPPLQLQGTHEIVTPQSQTTCTKLDDATREPEINKRDKPWLPSVAAGSTNRSKRESLLSTSWTALTGGLNSPRKRISNPAVWIRDRTGVHGDQQRELQEQQQQRRRRTVANYENLPQSEFQRQNQVTRVTRIFL